VGRERWEGKGGKGKVRRLEIQAGECQIFCVWAELNVATDAGAFFVL
jgi:hypothetical protein